MPKNTKKRMGRPPLPPEKKRGQTMGFKPTPEIRRLLQEAAEANSRSVSKEIEVRLERSLLDQGAIYEAFGGLEHSPLLAMLGNAIRMVEAGTVQKWQQDFETAAQVKEAINTIISAFSPKAKAPADEVFAGMLGIEVGATILRLTREAELSKAASDNQE